MNRKLLSLLALAPLLATAALAQEAPATEDPRAIEEIIVLAHPLSREGLAQAADVLEAVELERKAVDNIGATVGNEPGIHNSSYGVGAGRPVIHGLGGARVRVMEDRIDTLDVSVSSGDHAVTVDPFVAERVEVLKGSATLLYGSGAIGGVVDVQTGRIPQEVPERIRGALDLRARLSWRLRPADTTVDLYLAGRNLTDDEQRLHTSIVKDLAPQPGRTVEAGLRMLF